MCVWVFVRVCVNNTLHGVVEREVRGAQTDCRQLNYTVGGAQSEQWCTVGGAHLIQASSSSTSRKNCCSI